jgi:uncharacterized membrane protein
VSDAEPIVRHEPRWPAAVAIIVAMALYLILPQSLIIGPRWLLPTLEGLLVIPLMITNPDRSEPDTRLLRTISILLIALVSIANLSALGLLVHDLLQHTSLEGKALIFSAVVLWATSVIVFGLWYWELDGGGPAMRHERGPHERDFLFPQQASPDVFTTPWMPSFFDYLYTSFTNSTAFSPTDTMPLTTGSKALMMVQSGSALITVALVAARAVNILA